MAGQPTVPTEGGVSLEPHEVGLTLERSARLCPKTSLWRGGRPCSAHLVIVRLTRTAALQYEQRSRARWVDCELCLDPKTCGLGNMAHLTGLLELLR